ncbi:hypothetical protein AAFF_G00433840 [Aldrovandia affinis]|uniref:Uncharacterized protein n=1 Tax=Aldrovandia affinis TaxID=143900 RepID=A0AAD7VYQ1_9TELE|nr:hypothetical protein AAFF_G00433840 [Aldrovandia affinis]
MKWSTGWPGMAQAGLEEAVLDVRHRPRKLHTEKNYLAHNPSRENEPTDTDSPTAQAKHYRTLQALWKKPNPNKESVAQLLDLESGARRAFIDSDSIKEEDRHEQIIDAYPCFKDIGHVMDELRRILDRDNCQHIDEVKGRWADFCQKVQFYGVSKKILKPPMGMDKGKR